MKQDISFTRRITAALALAAMFVPVFAIAVSAQQMPAQMKAKALTEDQKILHVLNRLGFGARPGDMKRVKAVGLQKYIDEQLDPASIDDQTADAKVRNLEVLKLSNEEIFAKYPNNAAVVQILAQRNGMNRKQLRGDIKEEKQAQKSARRGAAMTENAMPNQMPNPQEMTEDERRNYRQQLAEISREYGFRRPAQINQQLAASRILRAVYSERQLQEQMVDFWTNHFNVYAGKGAVRWFLPGYDRDVIRPNALGNFRDLLVATAQSPAMLFFLDNFQSVSPNANQNNRRAQRLAQNGGELTEQQKQRQRERLRARGLSDQEIEQRMARQQNNQQRQRRGINENYARELMELHTLGVEGGYTQKDIQEVARAFTGWTIVDPRGYRNLAAKMDNPQAARGARGLMRLAGLPAAAESGTFFFNERAHDSGEKTVLGQKINEGGVKDGLKVIDVLVSHPSTARFIARKLAVKFVSDNPSEALVGRVAKAFQDSKGDIKTTLRALFADREFFAPENYRAKIKTPFELTVSAIRAVGADTNGNAVQAMLAKMGEPLYGYQAPTGYPDTAEDWVNTGALLERMNFSVALASNRIPGTKVNLKNFEARDKQAILDRAVVEILAGEIAPATKTTILRQLEQPLPEPKLDADNDSDDEDDAAMENAMMQPQNGQGGGRRGMNRRARLLAPSGDPEVFKVVGLLLGSPDFQRQ